MNLKLNLVHLGNLLQPRILHLIMVLYQLKVVFHQFRDLRIFGDKIGEAEAPGAPVAAHLADDELVLCLGFRYGLIYLNDGVDVLIIHLFQRGLSVGCGHDKHGGQNNK